MVNFEKNIVLRNVSARVALSKLDNASIGYKTLFVTDEQESLIGTLTDGDIRRGLIAGKDIDASVTEFMQTSYHSLYKGDFTLDDIDALKQKRVSMVPVLDAGRKIIKIVDLANKRSLLPVDAVIMAGGRGERLRPLTDTVPKPLLKVGEKPIIEYNVDRLICYGIDNISISIKYLGDKIIEFFGDGSAKGASIKYVSEEEPLGTIGAVKLCNSWQHDYVLVMNSDLLTNIDFDDFFKTFISKDADMAIATIPYQVKVPYAVLEVQNERIASFKEKPTYTYYSNAGIYLLKKELIGQIPDNTFFNATDLMEALIQENKKVVSYPILGYWLDIGKPDDYKKAQEDISHIKL